MAWRQLWSMGMGVAAAAAMASAGGPGQKFGNAGRDGWDLGEPVRYENLTVFPVVVRAGADTSGFLSLDEALASGQAVVTEEGGAGLRRSRDGVPITAPQSGPQVNQLVLINRSGKPLLLLAGEMVSGGKQDRIIGKDRIVAPGADPLPLDVFCVEHGRWSSGSAFTSAKLMVHPSVREKAAVDSNQSEVWAAVRQGSTSSSAAVRGGAAGHGVAATAPALSATELDRVAAAEAPTGSYRKIYESRRVGASVEEFADEVQRRFAHATASLKGEHVVGVVVAYGGEVAWSDVFASPALFERYWPKLLRSYVIEALARPGTQEHASLEDAKEFLRPLIGRSNEESEPGVYRWRQTVKDRYAEIDLEALEPKPITLHWVKIHRTTSTARPW